jgi:hypothetical protein
VNSGRGRIDFVALLLGKSRDGATVNNGQPADAAFRDCLYLGNLAAERPEDPHVVVGRWSGSSDRQSFAAGYESAYDGRDARSYMGNPFLPSRG